MAIVTKNRPNLLLGCGVTALAASLVLAPGLAKGQAFQATPTVTTGAATIDRGTPGTDVITADTSTVVIDWSPDEDGAGNALDFLPAGNTGIFQNNNGAGVTNFAVLNRILPSTNGNITVIDGTIISRLDNGAGFASGGFVAFYSPTGILVGSNAIFDVGGLMLTTLEPDISGFGNFQSGSTMNLIGQGGSTAPIFINPGATITGSPENSFFITAAAEVNMGGTASINGSQAYIGAEQVNITLSNGLFDIVIPVGTQAGTPINVNGDVGGPSSTGPSDNHIIYAVARAAAGPITMLFSGNLGFDPAVSAGIVNGEVILAANFDVFGRVVDGASTEDGLTAGFGQRRSTSGVGGDIIFLGGNYTSNTAAVASDRVRVFDPATFDGDLLLAGRDVGVRGVNSSSIDIAGDLLLNANDVAPVSAGLTTGEADAFGGGASILDLSGSSISVGGDVRVSASAFSGVDLDQSLGGSATAGSVQIGADGGSISIAGSTTLEAVALGSDGIPLQNAGDAQGGFAQAFAIQGGSLTFGGGLLLQTSAEASDALLGSSIGGGATGGTSELIVADPGSSAIAAGPTLFFASAIAGASDGAGSGAAATGGVTRIRLAEFMAANAGDLINLQSDVTMDASAMGGANAGGTGGVAQGGSSLVEVPGGGLISIDGSLTATTDATGGDGIVGGDASGGFFSALAESGDLSIVNSVQASSQASGGNATSGIGGFALGGSAFVSAATNTLNPATIGIGGSVNLDASGQAGGSAVAGLGAGGEGGDAQVTANGSPAATVSIGGDTQLTANGLGSDNSLGTGGTGNGGSARMFIPNGGDVTVAGNFTALARGTGGDGTDGGGGFGGIAGAIANVGTIDISGTAFSSTAGIGGDASFSFGGTGGDGLGGNAFFQADGNLVDTASIVIGGNATVESDGVGGQGGQGDASTIAAGRGGNGTGGNQETTNQADTNFASGAFLLAGGDNGNISVGGISQAFAVGRGGLGGDGGTGQSGGDGGNGLGGDTIVGLLFLGGDGSVGQGAATFGRIISLADGIGGNGGLDGIDSQISGAGGNGTGGESFITGHAGVFVADDVNNDADGFGGNGSEGGDGTGGTAGSFTRAGGSRTVANYFSRAVGSGGTGLDGAGGVGTGGTSFIGFQRGPMLITGNAGVNAGGEGGDSTNADGGVGIGGLANISIFTAEAGSGTVVGNVEVEADGFGGDALSSGFTGGTGTGGAAFLQSQAGGTITIGTALVSASGLGGTGPNAQGGDGVGGTAELLSNDPGSQLIIQRGTDLNSGSSPAQRGLVAANGVGGATTGGNGLGGTGTGGSALVEASSGSLITLPLDPANDPNSFGSNRILARGSGGSSSVEGGAGGAAFSGSGIIRADGGIITTGSTQFSIFASGGSSINAAANIDGGDATGGDRIIEVVNGGTLTGEFDGGVAGGVGGSGSGTGNGGNASSGIARILVDNGTFNSVGRTISIVQNFGGDGHIGGSATGGVSSMIVQNGGLVNVQPNANNDAELVIGGSSFGGNGDVAGGDSSGESASVVIDVDSAINGGALSVSGGAVGGGATTGPGGDATAGTATLVARGQMSGTSLTVQANGFGGDTGDGLAGSAVAGTARLVASNAEISYGAAWIAADATGGVATVGTNGDAQGGNALVELQGSSFNVAGDLVVRATSDTGTDTTNDGTGGNAFSDQAIVDVLFGSNLAAGNLDINTNATALQNGTADANGGGSVLRLVGGAVSATSAVLSSNAASGGGATSTGGGAAVDLEPDTIQAASLDIGSLTLETNALGAASNIGGIAALATDGSVARIDTLSVSATGDGTRAGTIWLADAGRFEIANSAVFNISGPISVQVTNGGLIGGPSVNSPTASITLNAERPIDINGNDDDAISFGGQSLTIIAPELRINPGARIGAEVMTLISTDKVNTAILGGTTDEAGFTLTQDEAGRIEAGSVSFTAPVVENNGPNDPDVLVRDLTIFGSLDEGPFSVNLNTDGIIRVEGVLAYVDAAATDSLEIFARERVEIVTPGGIGIFDAEENLSGNLSITSRHIWIGDDDLIGQLQADSNFAGRNDLLMSATSGSEDPFGFLGAGSVSLGVGSTLFVRNTGIDGNQAGIMVGEGGLSIFATDTNEGSSIPIDVFAYGQRDNSDGTFTKGEEFYQLVNFNKTGESFPSLYTDESEFNDCNINSGECDSGESPGVEEGAPAVNNPAVIVAPVDSVNPIPAAEEESNAEFGVDFPGLVEAPLLSEDPLLEDPVASGGDSSLYALSDDEDDEDDEDNEEDDEEDDQNNGGE